MKYAVLFDKVKDLVRDEACVPRPSFSVDDDNIEFAMRATVRATLHSIGYQVTTNGDVVTVAPAPAWSPPSAAPASLRRRGKRR